MTIYAVALGACDVRLWGVPAIERLRRQVAELGDAVMVESEEQVPAGAPLLVLRADHLFESRALQDLTASDGTLLRCPESGRHAAGFARTGDRAALVAAVAGPGDADGGFTVKEPDALAAYQGQLRKAEPPLVAPLTGAIDRPALEDRLYGRSYKGITDLVTKWLWPRPAKAGVRVCAELGVTPNGVTTLGLLLVVYAGWAFHQGDYWLGLAAGWFMTYLDTVDGKLARVTVRSSRIGHVLDHGMDIVHPPFWYVLWGSSLTGPVWGWPLETWYVWIFAGYVAGRLIEAAFHALGPCSLFDWRPFDSYFRLITARRNPCLIILTVALAAGSPAAAFAGVAVWTVATSAVLLVRLLQAAAARLRTGALSSWLADPEAAAARHPRAFRTFSRTRGAYAGG